MIPVSAVDRRLTSNSEAEDAYVADGEDGVMEALSGSADVLLQCSCRRAQCWHGAPASHYSLVLSTTVHNEGFRG